MKPSLQHQASSLSMWEQLYPFPPRSWQSWTRLSAHGGSPWPQGEAELPPPASVLSLLGLSKRTTLTFKSWICSPGQLLTEQLQCYLTLASSRFSGSSETRCPQAELPQILHPQIEYHGLHSQIAKLIPLWCFIELYTCWDPGPFFQLYSRITCVSSVRIWS